MDYAEIDAAFADFADLPDDFDGDPVPPPDKARADYYLRRMGQLDADERDLRQWIDDERTRLDDFLADRMSGIDRARGWLRRSLEGFMRQHHMATNQITLKLAHGELTLRADPGHVVVTDEAAFMAWARQHRPDLIRVPDPVPAKDNIKKLDRGAVIGSSDGNDLTAIVITTKTYAAEAGSVANPDGPDEEPEIVTTEVPGVAYATAPIHTFNAKAK